MEKEGLYPFRIVYWNKSGNAALEFYSIDLETEERILINDTENDNAIQAYTSAGQTRTPYVALAGPAPNTSGNSKDTPISIVLADDETKVDPGSVKLYVNRRRTKPTISTEGRHTYIHFQPEHKSLSELDYEVKLTFKDSEGTSFTREWNFSVDARDKIEITGYWNFSSWTPRPPSAALFNFSMAKKEPLPMRLSLVQPVILASRTSTAKAPQ